MADFLMPALGADMETGTLVEWLVEAGSHVKRGDVVAVVETHKGAIDVEIFMEGEIVDLVPLGTQLPIGGVLAHVRVQGEDASTMAAPLAPAQPAPSVSLPAKPAPIIAGPPSAGMRCKISPAARRRALQLGIDPGRLQGHGIEGSVTLADVESAASFASGAPAKREPGFDPAQMRQAIATVMSRSKREIPHYYLQSTIDFGPAAAWLELHNRDLPPEERLLPAVLLLKATALALVQRPQLNGFYIDGAFRPGPGLHIGWAIALRGGGLIAPAIHDVDHKTVQELMHSLRDLVQRARSGGLRSSELSDATLTVTSLGDRGADAVLGVIYPPQVAMVGFGRLMERPWIVDGQVVPRWVLQASLAADHRASDGHVGGLLLAAIDHALQSPETL